jgi:hypothetical protein
VDTRRQLNFGKEKALNNMKITRRGFAALLGTLTVSGCLDASGGGSGGGGGNNGTSPTQIFLQPGNFKYGDITAVISVDGSIMTTTRIAPIVRPSRTYRQTGINTFQRVGGSTVATIIDQNTIRFNDFVWKRVS